MLLPLHPLPRPPLLAAPRLVVAPSFLLGFLFIYGLIAWNGYLSLSASRLLPNYEFVGLDQYVRLFENERFHVAMKNMAVFGGLFVGGAMALGLLLAVLLDLKIRAEGVLRTVYLYPMAFLAGLRGIDESIVKAAQVDGASLPRIYWRILIPSLRPVFFSTLMVVSHLAIKSFDLVMALTAGGPGYATDLPATFMYAMAFSRGQIGLGAAAATVMLATVAAIVVPYLYSELRARR